MAVKRTTAKAEKTTTSVRKPSIRRRKAAIVSPEDIATRAYFLHLEGGNDPLENWLQAERELAVAS